MLKLNWEKGRTTGGYRKLRIFEIKSLKVDCYILHYPKNSYVVTHQDVVKGFNHHRLNIVLKRPAVGGVFYCWHQDQKKLGSRFVKFRPDIQPHGVFKVEEGSRWVLSFGWLRRSKK